MDLYTKNTWIDRNVEFPHRYEDELGNIKTFTSSPGTVTEEGTAVTASKMNNIENGIYNAHQYITMQKRKLRMGVRV